MKLPTYLRRYIKKSGISYAIGGMAGILAVGIFGVFSLSMASHYLLRADSLAAVISSVLVDLANNDRGARLLDGLTVNPVLVAAAQAKADDMAAKGYFAHVSPEGKDSWYWFRQVKYPFLYAGENLAVDFSDSVDVERAWMNSSTHRANILNGHFTEIGIATARGTFQGRSTTFVVQMFGAPAEKGAPLNVAAISSLAKPTAPAFAVAATPTPTPTKVVRVVTATPAPSRQVLGAEAAAIAPTSAPAAASWWQHLLASPKAMLRYAYYVFAGVILILLAFVTEFEFHKRHMRHVVAATVLFMLMAGLFALANFVFFATPVLASS